MDEIAAHVKADPVAYRLRHLSDVRGSIDVVQAAAKAARSGTRARRRSRRSRAQRGVASGRGIACVAYEGDNGYVAMVAEVEVDQATGTVTAKRFVVAQDCGPISNPDGMRNQIEGGALQGMSRALGEEVTWDDHEGDVDRLADLPQPARSGADVPSIESVLVDRTDVERPAPAKPPDHHRRRRRSGNAIFDATGARLREIPFTPERVKGRAGGQKLTQLSQLRGRTRIEPGVVRRRPAFTAVRAARRTDGASTRQPNHATARARAVRSAHARWLPRRAGRRGLARSIRWIVWSRPRTSAICAGSSGGRKRAGSEQQAATAAGDAEVVDQLRASRSGRWRARAFSSDEDLVVADEVYGVEHRQMRPR